MICKYCGKPVEPDEKHCPYCGKEQGSLTQMVRLDRSEFETEDVSGEKKQARQEAEREKSSYDPFLERELKKTKSDVEKMKAALKEQKKQNTMLKKFLAGTAAILLVAEIGTAAAAIRAGSVASEALQEAHSSMQYLENMKSPEEEKEISERLNHAETRLDALEKEKSGLATRVSDLEKSFESSLNASYPAGNQPSQENGETEAAANQVLTGPQEEEEAPARESSEQEYEEQYEAEQYEAENSGTGYAQEDTYGQSS